jgi:hypothetical protein
MARYGVAQPIWRLDSVDLCPPCEAAVKINRKEAPK